MFGVFNSLAKAALGTVKLPVDLVADIATMGGALTDKDKPYTVEGLEKVYENLEKAVDPKS